MKIVGIYCFCLDCSNIMSNVKQNYKGGQITNREMHQVVKNLFQGRLTSLHWDKGEEMAPTLGAKCRTLLVRKIPDADTS